MWVKSEAQNGYVNIDTGARLVATKKLVYFGYGEGRLLIEVLDTEEEANEHVENIMKSYNNDKKVYGLDSTVSTTSFKGEGWGK